MLAIVSLDDANPGGPGVVEAELLGQRRRGRGLSLVELTVLSSEARAAAEPGAR